MNKSNKRPNENEHAELVEKKYSRETICNPKKIKKGVTRWNQFSQQLLEIYPQAQQGPLLDFGSGIGYFVLEGLRRKLDIWGVDILPGKVQRYQKLIDYTKSPGHWKTRCLAGNGEELPFPKETFAAVSSWYVFEHIPRPGQCIREMIRVTRPEGIIAIRAQDARNGWEGHCKIPWIPFLPDRLAQAWMEEFGVDPTLREDVVDITQPQIAAILEELGCRVIIQAKPPRQLINGQHELATERAIRRKARQIRQDFESGRWQPQPENLYIYAQKLT
ncbi:MAG: class I SAM-dependent methyltransferase [Desulfocapsaceae bacterium]|nr:class I SAM-dependent methyltransferase [Desulfocapsaceae bacterium]